MQHVAGYTVCNDYAIRDYLENWYRPNLRVKNRDDATVLGPWFGGSLPHVPNPHQLTLRTLVNGEVKQQGSTANMVNDIPALIEYLSSFMTLQAGDVHPHRHTRRRGECQRGRRSHHRNRRHRPARQHHRQRRPVWSLTPATATEESMRIEHLIGGQSVPGSSYFETINPATQEVLAEVAAGGTAEVDAAVAAAKAAFPAWANTPATERAKLMRKLGDLIARHVPEIAQTETQDCRPGHLPDRQAVGAARGRQLPLFRRDARRVDGHTYPTPTHLNYTLFHPVGVCALISPWNVPFMTSTWKVAPCLAFGNTAVLKMSELSPLTAARLGALALEAGIPPGVLERGAWLRPGSGRAPGGAPGCAGHQLHRLHCHR